MKNSSNPRGQDTLPAKRPYRTPALKVLGDFRKLTAAKGGMMGDGSGKPNTRRNGSNS